MKEKSISTERLSLGVCYYPEHWDESLWDEDLSRMLESGIETIRIGEFAWNKFEPREGEFTFDFFHRFLDLAEKHGMKVIFGTPTATPPAWLTQKYPEVLNANIDGVLYRHGERRHYNYNSPKYQELCSRLVKKLAEQYAGRKSLIGWQIDNEINCELDVFYSESDTLAFREFLQKKYKTLDALNEAWGTVFWNQTYTAWEEVYVPRTVTAAHSTNPHEVLDYIRFVSHSAIHFVKLQADILRPALKPGDFITTNGIFGNLDNHKMTEEALDFITYDSYPNFAFGLDSQPDPGDFLKDRKWSRNLSEARSVSPKFGIMEQQSGANGWTSRMLFPAPKPGQMTLWAMQSIAHGADFVSFFRWRTSPMGNEIYWHGILDYDNRDNRKLQEVQNLHEMLSSLPAVAGSSFRAEFAYVEDYDNRWDSQVDKWHERFEGASYRGIFEAAQLAHAPMDYLYLHEDSTVEELAKYKVLFYPHAVILTKHIAALLTEYVSGGGTLVLGCRTGYKDETGKCPMQILPGLAGPLAGVDVFDSTFVGPQDNCVMVDWDGQAIEAAVYNDILKPAGPNAQVLGTYLSNYYKGQPGLIRNRLGKGQVYYFGGAFSKDTATVFLQKLQLAKPYGELLELPAECELTVREKDGERFLFVLNFSGQPAKVQLKKPLPELLSGKELSGEDELPPYAFRVYLA